MGTGFVEFDWQLWKEGPLLFAANAYPFEPMPEGMWNAGQPNDNLPYMEPCTASAGDGIQDGGCINNDWFAGQTIICEAAWNVETPASKRGDANLMQNARERGQANLMHNARERGQANPMHNAQERGQANMMQNARERGQANLMHNAQVRGQANLMHNARERGEAEERRQ